MLKNKNSAVSRFYNNLIAELSAVSSENTFACCDVVDMGKIRGRFIGYREEDLSIIPPDISAQTCGCGNPLSAADAQSGDVIVDLGCGAGIDLLLAADNVGADGRVIGVDVAPDMVTRAKANATHSRGAPIGVREASMDAVPLDDATVDWVISNFAISLSSNKGDVFSEMYRILRPGGRFAVADLCVDGLPAWLADYEHLRAVGIAGAVSVPDYVAGLQQAGFRDVEVLDRVDYSVEQITQFIEALYGGGRVLGGLLSPNRVARALEGRLQSVQFVGRKPACEPVAS